MTTDTHPGYVERARAVGVDTVMTKPLTPDVLWHEVRRILAPSESSHPASDDPPRPTGTRRTSHVRAHLRTVTTMPPVAPPPVHCPSCDHLTYDHSYIGGVNHRNAEQWDAYTFMQDAARSSIAIARASCGGSISAYGRQGALKIQILILSTHTVSSHRARQRSSSAPSERAPTGPHRRSEHICLGPC